MEMNNILVIIIATMICSCDCFSRLWSLSNALLSSGNNVNSFANDDQADTVSTAVMSGAEKAMAECAYQFKNDVWNCPTAAFDADKAAAAADNREGAFVAAILSAGVVHTVARNCSAGQVEDCGCELNGPISSVESWQWGGCSDNVLFGSKISRQYLDQLSHAAAKQAMSSSQSGEFPKVIANKHNNEAGRVAIRKTMKRVCKCHGVSGSCATQTCWRQVGAFRQTGDFLKQQYNGALKVDYSNGKLLRPEDARIISNNVGRRSLTNAKDRSKKSERSIAQKSAKNIKKRKLVFLETSPDYCRVNPVLGYPGVVGRKCVVDPSETETNKEQGIAKCAQLCTACGLKVKKEIVHVSTTCNCKFEWCCNITCQKCTKEQIIITCEAPTPKYNYKSILSNAT